MRLRDLVIDLWSPLSHKQPLAQNGRGTEAFARSWLTDDARRRLTAYQILLAYQSNVARSFLPEDDTSAGEHREYGDPALMVKQITAHLLGKEQSIRVPGAEDFDPESATSQGESAPEEAQAAYERQQYLRDWAIDERLPLKMMEAEKRAVGLGDGVYLLAWSTSKNRPRLRVIDPGFYFPVLPEGLEDDYPARIHLAWEIPGVDGFPDRLRRVTYELGPISPATRVEVFTDRLRRLVNLTPENEPVPMEGDRFTTDGRIVRTYPWGDTSSVTCYLTDAEWNLRDLPMTATLDTLPLDRAIFHTNEDGELLDRLDLRIDFVPIVHIPNTPATLEHFGTSSISDVLQLFDDLAAADTDLQASSATTGTPPIGLAGARPPSGPDGTPERVTVAPGEVWFLGEGGKLHALDTSNSLKALRDYVSDLRDRMAENMRVPASVLGRARPEAFASGIHLQLSFGPMQSLIRELRLTRGEKYPLMMKFVQRLAMAGGALPPGDVYDVEVLFGSFLPSDVAEVVKNVRQLMTPPQAISLESAITMLMEVGLPIEDAAAEVQRIREHDYESANRLADATGDQDAVRELLALPARAAVVPALNLPGVPTPTADQ